MSHYSTHLHITKIYKIKTPNCFIILGEPASLSHERVGARASQPLPRRTAVTPSTLRGLTVALFALKKLMSVYSALYGKACERFLLHLS